MKKDRICKYCQTFFPNEEGKVFSNHVRWCNENLTNGDKGISLANSSRKKTIDLKIENEKGFIQEFNVSCKKCLKNIIVNEWSKLHPQKDKYFCSRKCSNSRGERTTEFKNIVSKKLSKPKFFISCPICNKDMPKEKKTCSKSCALKNRHLNKIKVETGSLKEYRSKCSFRFLLNDYPDEFNFSLIEKYGWYAAKNRGNNLNGVSRDHIISVKFGYENKIDPKIISHPANCQLLPHNKNASKNKKCGLTIEELMIKIEKWNNKYSMGI